MAATRETDATLVKPLEGAIVRRFTAGSAIEAAEAVAMASDAAIDPADASTATLADVLGIALGPDDYAAGDRVDVVVFGPVVCMTAATEGARVFLSDTAGGFAETAGTVTRIIGIAEQENVLFVNPMWVNQT